MLAIFHIEPDAEGRLPSDRALGLLVDFLVENRADQAERLDAAAIHSIGVRGITLRRKSGIGAGVGREPLGLPERGPVLFLEAVMEQAGFELRRAPVANECLEWD